MSKPNDLKQRKDKGSQNKETPFQLSQYLDQKKNPIQIDL
jgi:hypothetical protein